MKTKATVALAALSGTILGVLGTFTFLTGHRAAAQGYAGAATVFDGILRPPPVEQMMPVASMQAIRVPTSNGAWRVLWRGETADGRTTLYWEEGGPLQAFPRK